MHLDVRLHGESVGTLEARGAFVRFYFNDNYLESRDRSVLGLKFEEDVTREYTSQDRLPSWFENLLPEGSLKQLVEAELRTILGRTPSQMEVLLQVGSDLPGAVTVEPYEGAVGVRQRFPLSEQTVAQRELGPWLTSAVAGVGLKFSVLRQDEKFVAPATGSDGDWLVKLPDPQFRLLPQNEFASMGLGRRVGINVPAVRLVSRDELEGVPDRFWRGETEAFVIERFDRENGARTHIEDFAQVRGLRVDDRYAGNFETLAGYVWRRSRDEDLIEFVRRLTLNLMIGNDDAHLKNWSVRYSDRKRAELSPVYDVVSVQVYDSAGLERGTGLKLANSRRYEDVNLAAFDRIGRKIGYHTIDLRDVVRETVGLIETNWSEYESDLRDDSFVRRVREHKEQMKRRLS
ncbi:type II toxin-antitoxin system HipA family toxin [Microbacterium sp. BG28]|uniref:type II toxin-antitoxin system HipA family toxin n=1 Tax=Microbacterium sp. BG28 TaxID=3097356 RepID=UPI002A598D28|nr:type II toxin-antitoxin system HipA family toxin [Microbacterium sp. BG28]MDY0830552.1 type II toxin-antitoxin system HipA family toxin [Microbacterium sp. BG28]